MTGAFAKIWRMGRRWRFGALLVVLYVALALSACSSDPPAPGPEVQASALAAALAASFADGKIDTEPPAEWSAVSLTNDSSGVNPGAVTFEVLGPLGKVSVRDSEALQSPPTVDLVSVSAPSDGSREGSTAVATFNWVWNLDNQNSAVWTYQTQAELEYVNTALNALYAEGGQAGEGAGWAVRWSPSILAPDISPGERLKVLRTVPTRASILDSLGEPLVEPRPVWRIGIDKTLVPSDQWEEGARALVDLVASAGYAFDPDAYVARVAGAGERAFVDLITVRQETWPLTRSDVEQIPGGRALSEMKDLAPTPTFAKAILGSVGEATAEILEASDGSIVAGDMTGLSGLQKTYNFQLTGTPGISVYVTDTAGQIERGPLFERETIEGDPLAVTLNTEWQTIAENLLASVTPAASIVAIQPSTGAVRVAANGPGSAGYNTAFLGQYPPGSTFKVIDALALRRAGLDATSIVPCSESISVDGRTFVNVPGYPTHALGNVPLRTAFANSCNTAFVSQSSVLSPSDIVGAAQDLGFQFPTPGLGVGAFFGSVPSDPSSTEHAADLLGQGLVTASPLTMARVAASVAAGHRVDPVLLDCKLPSGGLDSFCILPGDAGYSDDVIIEGGGVTADEAAFVLDLMHSVVEEGSATILQDIPGIKGAKTGTAQFGDGSKNHTWMIAIADDLAVAVFVEEGEFGSTTSGPIMHDFLAAVS